MRLNNIAWLKVEWTLLQQVLQNIEQSLSPSAIHRMYRMIALL